MAILKPQLGGVVDYVSALDDAIDTSIDPATGNPKSDLEAYRETGDASKLVFLADKQPTIFKMKLSLDVKKSMAVKNASIGTGKDEPGFKLGSHQFELVRSCLVDIINPPYVPADQRIEFKRYGDGRVHDETLEYLDACGLLDELYTFVLKVKNDPNLLKKK